MDRLCWKALALQSFRVRRVNYLSVKHSLQHLELHGTHWAASSLRGSWSFVANPESFWYETFSLCSLLIQALPLTRCSADAFSLLILLGLWLWTFAAFVQYVAQWDPDTHVKPLGGSVIQIMMLLSSQDIFTLLSFRLCHFFTPIWPYSSVSLSFFS